MGDAPLHGGCQARLRVVGKPKRLCAQLRKKMNLRVPLRPKNYRKCSGEKRLPLACAPHEHYTHAAELSNLG